MTESNAEAKVLADVERKLPALEDYSEDELLAEVGQYEIGAQLFDPSVEVGSMLMLKSGNTLMTESPVRRTICKKENRKLIEGLLDIPFSATGVSKVVMALAGILGITMPIIVVPTGLIAIALLLIRYDLANYCDRSE